MKKSDVCVIFVIFFFIFRYLIEIDYINEIINVDLFLKLWFKGKSYVKVKKS